VARNNPKVLLPQKWHNKTVLDAPAKHRRERNQELTGPFDKSKKKAIYPQRTPANFGISTQISPFAKLLDHQKNQKQPVSRLISFENKKCE